MEMRRLLALLELAPDKPEIHYQLGVCFSGTCRVNSLTDPEIALEYFRFARRCLVSSTPDRTRARVLSDLGRAYVLSSRQPRRAQLQAAIECFGQAAEVYLRSGKRDEWAAELQHLGTVRRALSVEKGSRRLSSRGKEW